jgi:hypothetical protein
MHSRSSRIFFMATPSLGRDGRPSRAPEMRAAHVASA